MKREITCEPFDFRSNYHLETQRQFKKEMRTSITISMAFAEVILKFSFLAKGCDDEASPSPLYAGMEK
ncbi:MAG: hypothetical protein JXR76_28925 [Deltaproteobacteria bacterium]|nr:hypothetical protein [Deltaproteobacteria bacterium]